MIAEGALTLVGIFYIAFKCLSKGVRKDLICSDSSIYVLDEVLKGKKY